eukprot:m.182505 g.182505  ORF g.182505 m.182505 type:complete len:348 (-) comp18463_c0_seq2:1025-2068(-)
MILRFPFSALINCLKLIHSICFFLVIVSSVEVHGSKVAMTVIPIPESSEGLRGPLKKLMPKYENTWRHNCKRRMAKVQPLSLVIGVHYSQLQLAPAVAHFACRDQSAPPDEVVVVIGGVSPAEAVNLARLYVPCKGRFASSETQLVGGQVRNIGASLARNSLVTFLDGDDLAHPQWFDTVRFMQAHTNFQFLAHQWHEVDCTDLDPDDGTRDDWYQCTDPDSFENTTMVFIDPLVKGEYPQIAWPHITVRDFERQKLMYESLGGPEDSRYLIRLSTKLFWKGPLSNDFDPEDKYDSVFLSRRRQYAIIDSLSPRVKLCPLQVEIKSLCSRSNVMSCVHGSCTRHRLL